MDKLCVVKPVKIQTSRGLIKFGRLSKKEMTRFVQEDALNGLMRGVPFGEIIEKVMWYGFYWAEETEREDA